MARKLIQTLTNDAVGLVAKVYRDSEWREYLVRLYRGGVLDTPADYHTDDKADASATARRMAGLAVTPLTEEQATALATGGVMTRGTVIGWALIDDAGRWMRRTGLDLDAGGCLDAPEHMPSGSLSVSEFTPSAPRVCVNSVSRDW